MAEQLELPWGGLPAAGFPLVEVRLGGADLRVRGRPLEAGHVQGDRDAVRVHRRPVSHR